MKYLNTFLLIIWACSVGVASRNGTPVGQTNPTVVLIPGANGNGTGILIGKDLILTVNHVVENTPVNWLKVIFNYSPGQPLKEIRVKDSRIFSSDLRNELVLLRLKQPVELTPYPIKQDIIKTGSTIFGIGYGIGQKGSAPQSLLQSQMKFRGYFEVRDDITIDGHPVPGPFNKNIMGELVPGNNKNQLSCSGDSGGPAFIMENKQLKIAGIIDHLLADNSNGSPEDMCQKAHLVRFIPLNAYMDWLIKSAREMGSQIP